MNTTDQQAVTVAINSDDRDMAKEWWQMWDGGKTQMPWSLQYQFALHRLASVSSASAIKASAEVSLMYLQTGFIECPQCGEEVSTKDMDAAYELATVVQPAPFDTSPEPVPATNQAGEVVAWRERDGDEWVYYDADSDTGKHIAAYQRDRHNVSVFPLYAALATQPATSQEGEGLALRAIKAVTATAKDGAAGLSRIMAITNAAGVRASYSELLQDPAVALIVEHPRTEWAHLFKPDATGCAIPPEGWQCSRARGHTGPCAATPTPPTLSEDLREAWNGAVFSAIYGDTSDPFQDPEAYDYASRVADKIRAALAQVKAS